MNNLEVNRLYTQISNDLQIVKLSCETEKNFHCRLVYSAIGFWILNFFKDRYTNDDTSVSKMHVSLSACNILKSFIKIDDSLAEYFTDINKFVFIVENTYLNLGYIDSGKYTFKNMVSKQRVQISIDHTLLIHNELYNNRMLGVGIIKSKKIGDIELSDFFNIRLDAKQYFCNMVKNLKFDYFEHHQGNYLIYNIQKNCWQSYSHKSILEKKYTISKVDGGLKYAVIKKSNDDEFIAYLPDIYSISAKDFNYINEIWRVILGCCKYNNFAAKVFVKKLKEANIYSFKGYILPENETAFIRAISWPLGCACYDGKHSPNGYLVIHEFVSIFEEVLSRFNLIIEEIK